jgi:shikimate kinase
VLLRFPLEVPSCHANNHELLNGENVLSVYLKAIETLFNRLVINKQKTPIANKNEEEMKEFIMISLKEAITIKHNI